MGKNALTNITLSKENLKRIFEQENEGKQVRGKLNYPIEQEIVGIANLVKERNQDKDKKISGLKTSDGNICNDFTGIHKTITDFYQNLFTLEPHNPLKRSELLQYIKTEIKRETNKFLEV